MEWIMIKMGLWGVVMGIDECSFGYRVLLDQRIVHCGVAIWAGCF